MNRERLTILRDHLAMLPDQRLDMRAYFSRCGAFTDDKSVLDECGTAACVAGWASYLFGGEPEDADKVLGLTYLQDEELCYPDSFRVFARYTREDAILALQSMLDSPDDDALPIWPERAV